MRKFGQDAALFPTGLLLLCGKDAASPPAGPVSTCDRSVDAPDDDPRRSRGTCTCSGRSIRVELNPGTPRAQRPARHPALGLPLAGLVRAAASRCSAEPGDVLRVTCRHDAALRETIRPRAKPRYVLWGEGTTDEMCLGILQVTRG